MKATIQPTQQRVDLSTKEKHIAALDAIIATPGALAQIKTIAQALAFILKKG